MAFAATFVLGGCGRPAGVLFDPAASQYRWPPPPDEARIQYLGSLASDADLKPAVSGLAALGESLFGKEDSHAFLSPMAIASDGHDRVFIVDSNAQVVHACNLATRAYERWSPPKGAPGFSQPVAAVYDPSGRLLVSDSVGGRIFAFGNGGEFLGVLGEGLLKRPCGIAIDARGEETGWKIYVADSAAHQVVVLAPGGREIARIGQRGGGPGEFNFPTNVAVDSRGRVYVSDSLNFRVQIFSERLEPVAQLGKKGDMPGYFSQPKGLAVDTHDRLYVVDANFEAVQVFDVSGEKSDLLMTFGKEGRGPGEFWLPAGAHVDGAGRLWVADIYNRRVQVFSPIEPESAKASAAGDAAPGGQSEGARR